MTIVVAVTKNDRTVLAADSLTSFGESHRVPSANAQSAKIRRIGAALLGASGWGLYDRILDAHLGEQELPSLASEGDVFAFFLDLWRAMRDKYTLVNEQANSKDTPFGDLDASFLIGGPGGIFKVSEDMDVTRFEQYYAIGSGAEFALGALHALYDGPEPADVIARRAVEAAIAFDVSCDGEISVLAV